MTGNDRVRPHRTGVGDVTWPLTGRAAELEQVTARLANRHGAIVLAGPAGVGKTRLGIECLGIAASQGFVPFRVAATQGAAGLPFGAFAHLVPELAPTSDRLAVLRQIARAVAASGDGKPVALFVDDVHLLDESSAVLTHLLATTDGVFVLATLRAGEPAPDPIMALWKDGLAERLELRPLSVSDVAELLVAALGGPVDGGAVQVLHTRTEGNVLFLRELVLGALDAGVLRSDEGVWRLGGLPPASSRLVEIIEARLGHLDEPFAQALGVLALGEPLEVDLLHVVDPLIDLQALERRGLMRIEQQGRRLAARLPHPLYAEVLRSRLSPLRARDSARALADALRSTGARRREDTLRLAMWSLDGGSPLDPAALLTAATTARQRYDFALAERLARAAVDAGAGFEAGLLMAQVCWLQGRAADALDQLGGLADSAGTDAQRTLLAMTRISVLDWGLKQTDAALRVAEEAELVIADPACRDQVTAERARILGRSGRNAAAVAIAVPLLERVTGSALVSACFAAGTSMCVTGQFAAGMAATERGLAAHLQLEGPPLPFGPYLHLAIRIKLLLGAGRIPEAVTIARTEYDKAVAEGSIEAHSFFSFELAHALLSEGRIATAERFAAEAAGAFRQLRWTLWVRNSLAARAHALALLGDAPAAGAVLTELDALGVPPSELLGPEVLQARAWTGVAAGDLVTARTRLEEAVALAKWSGAYALESAALHDLARLGRAEETTSRLRELTGVVEGGLAPARAEHAAALATQDAARLEAASAAFERCGAVLLAAEVASDAATAWRKTGETRRATAADRRSRALAARCEGARTPSLATPTPARAALTQRELEIAGLAATGLANREIAARLYLSHRTVENKLYAVYEKLGVSGRSELAGALEGPRPGDAIPTRNVVDAAANRTGAAESPGGMVALLFTDQVGSTTLLERLGEDAAEELRRFHFSLLRRAVTKAGGHEVKNLGDGLMVRFPSSVQAVRCAVAMQRSIADHNRARPERRLQVRIGLHVGEPLVDDNDLFGTSVVVTKRLCDQAQGGQILASEVLASMVGSRGGFRFRPVGRLALKGLAQPVAAAAVDWHTSPTSSRNLVTTGPDAGGPPERRSKRSALHSSR